MDITMTQEEFGKAMISAYKDGFEYGAKKSGEQNNICRDKQLTEDEYKERFNYINKYVGKACASCVNILFINCDAYGWYGEARCSLCGNVSAVGICDNYSEEESFNKLWPEGKE